MELRPSVSSSQAVFRPTPWRRRVLWVIVALVLLALLVLTPPLINANRYRLRIAETMSNSLGRPVHLDSVSMHLLPVPGFTLQNLVVSENPAFGAEPIIRANTVEATLRVSSLWHRPVEFSTVRFVEPSVNLVRNPEGRWNLADIVLHASHVRSAPTAQRSAGPSPRFPYIEATGGRVNIKLGAEKLPFSLTNADFALWLPSADTWRLRLAGQPNRTDVNISESGTLRIEGELHRATRTTDVPVNLHASWHNAPLGEASRILAGSDLGWRGLLNVDAALEGTLGQASLKSQLTLGGLRRAEFFPAHPLDLQVTCAATLLSQPAATLHEARCTLPDNAPEPLALHTTAVPLQNPTAAPVTIEGDAIPVRWALLWAALFSARVPGDLHPQGTVSVHISHGESTSAAPSLSLVAGSANAAHHPPAKPSGTAWNGTITLHLPKPAVPPPSQTDAEAQPTNELVWTLGAPLPSSPWPSLHLAATPVTLGPEAQLTVSGAVTSAGYTATASGEAPAAAILLPARYLPQLGDGLEQVLPYPPTGTTPQRVQFTCARSWGQAASCTSTR